MKISHKAHKEKLESFMNIFCNYSVAQAQSIRTGQHGFPNGSTIPALIYPISLSSRKAS
jgi:hypothetical protein